MIEMNGKNFSTNNVKCYSKINKNFFNLNGKIFVLDLHSAPRIRTGETENNAL